MEEADHQAEVRTAGRGAFKRVLYAESAKRRGDRSRGADKEAARLLAHEVPLLWRPQTAQVSAGI